MSRFHALAARPLRTLGVLATVLTAVGVAIGSGASFSAQTANPNNAFTAGSLTMSNSKAAAAILTASGLTPGDATTGTVDIENTGTIPGTFSVSRTNLTNSDGANPMSQQMDLEIVDCGTFASGTPTCDGGDPVVYSGTLDAMSAAIDLGGFDEDERHRYEFEATFAASAGNQYQGDNTTARFQWDAVQ